MQQNTGHNSTRPNLIIILGIAIAAIAIIIIFIIVFAMPKNNSDSESSQSGVITPEKLLSVLNEVRENSRNFEDVISGIYRGQFTLVKIYDDPDYRQVIEGSLPSIQNLYDTTKNYKAVQGQPSLDEVLGGLNTALSARISIYTNFVENYKTVGQIWDLTEDAKTQLDSLKSSSNTNLRALSASLQDYYDLTSPILNRLNQSKCDYDEIKTRFTLTQQEDETVEAFLRRRMSGISSTCLTLSQYMENAKRQFDDDGTLAAKILYASGEYTDSKETIYGYVNALENALGVDHDGSNE